VLEAGTVTLPMLVMEVWVVAVEVFLDLVAVALAEALP
jgi:hypothetical protein